MDTDDYEIPEFPASKTIQKQQKYVLFIPGWLQPYSNGKQDLKFITQEHSVQQQGKCWCRPNIFSAYCKFYFRVITLVIISLTVPGSNMKQILHSDWLIKWLLGLLFFFSVFMEFNFVPGQKMQKRIWSISSHHDLTPHLFIEGKKAQCSLFFLTMFHLRCSICQCHHRKILLFLIGKMCYHLMMGIATGILSYEIFSGDTLLSITVFIGLSCKVVWK